MVRCVKHVVKNVVRTVVKTILTKIIKGKLVLATVLATVLANDFFHISDIQLGCRYNVNQDVDHSLLRT